MAMQCTSAHTLSKTFSNLSLYPFLPLNFENSCSNLNHLVIFDYARWSQSEDGEDEHALLTLDARIDNMKRTRRSFATAEGKLYLVRAYFDDFSPEIDMIIQVSEQCKVLNLTMSFNDGTPDFKVDASYVELTEEQADRIVTLLEM
jgi:hypothetical protein